MCPAYVLKLLCTLVSRHGVTIEFADQLVTPNPALAQGRVTVANGHSDERKRFSKKTCKNISFKKQAQTRAQGLGLSMRELN